MPSRLTDLPDWAAALLEEIPVAHLGLLDERGHPRVQPVTFARVDDTIVSAIDDKPKRGVPARIERLRRHPRAALTVDRYDADWTRLAWVQVLGDVTIEAVDRESLAALQRRYAAYVDRPPNGPLLKLAPVRVLIWRASG
jgi:PPOX class probable F420-dependent enzyme